MSDEKIVIKGVFTGYYSLSKPLKGSSNSYNLVWDQIIVNSFERIEDYKVNELKIGNYQYIGELKNFQLLSPKKHKIQQELLKFVILKDIEILNSVSDNEKKFFKAKGIIYAKTPYTPTLKINKQLKKAVISPENVIKNSVIPKLKESKGCINLRNRISNISSWFRNSKINNVNNNYFKSNINSNKTGCNRKSSNGGCITFLLFFIGLSLLISSFSTSPLISAIILGLFGLFLILASFIPRLRGSIGSIIGMLFLLFMMGAALSYISNFINEDWWQQNWIENKSDEEKKWEKQRERAEVETENTDGSGEKGPITYFQHNHNWKENRGTKQNSKFRVRKNYFDVAKEQRKNIKVNTTNTTVYWNKIYSSIIENDQGKLTEICKMYDQIGKQQNLNYNQFADMVVTSIQWIPYVLVLEKSCEDSKYDGGFVTEYLLSGKPCLGNIKFGIQSPVEFMSNFKGDCDTRSVLCFMILDQFGYDVAVLVSEKYGHAILGININSGGGDYIKHKGKRYYVWETTATGFKVGNIPPGCSNLRYWRPALTN